MALVTCIYRWKTLYKCIHEMTDMWIYETGTQKWPYKKGGGAKRGTKGISCPQVPMQNPIEKS